MQEEHDAKKKYLKGRLCKGMTSDMFMSMIRERMEFLGASIHPFNNNEVNLPLSSWEETPRPSFPSGITRQSIITSRCSISSFANLSTRRLVGDAPRC